MGRWRIGTWLGMWVTVLGATVSVAQSPADGKAAGGFVVYDNIFYSGKPDLRPFGMVGMNIIYDRDLWPTRTHEEVMPSRAVFDGFAKKATQPGPLVLDIEFLGPLDSAEKEEELETLLQWAHEDVPGKAVGFYGTNTLTKVKRENWEFARKLAAHVDAMFPPMYSYNRDQSAWAAKAKVEADEARALAPGKPVYFYLQPQYHHTTPLAYQYVEGDFWAFQLKTARKLVDGVVIWTGTRWGWSDSADWWVATRGFLDGLRK